ncbi:hypothetical protein M7I_2977 [Glarea lozoyensis 74030]|uniref:Uncharacterized protein n=1 Tax=Glarea lozoyensis (strain ATCC 74030 / MF5533) TaxID=1104152 RepID=H0EK84_GLAL7|nr:hypothetical protein M7I_2977 [Glarea lozoyensis 74030]
MNIDIGEVRRVLQRHLREGFYGEVVESGSEEEKAGEDAGNKKSGEMKENGGMTGENGENGENGDRVKGGEEVKEDGSERKGVVEARKGNGDKIVGVKRGKGGRFQSAKRNWGGLEKEFLKQMIDSLDARIVLGRGCERWKD